MVVVCHKRNSARFQVRVKIRTILSDFGEICELFVIVRPRAVKSECTKLPNAEIST
jgi:hypothetical protein